MIKMKKPRQSPRGIKNEWKKLATLTSHKYSHHSFSMHHHLLFFLLCTTMRWVFVCNTCGAANRLFATFHFDSLFPRLWFLIAHLLVCVHFSRRHWTEKSSTTCVTLILLMRSLVYCVYISIVRFSFSISQMRSCVCLCVCACGSVCVCVCAMHITIRLLLCHYIASLESITRRLSLAKWTNDFCFVNIHEIWIH